MLRDPKGEKRVKGSRSRDDGTPGCWNAGTLECCEARKARKARKGTGVGEQGKTFKTHVEETG